MQSLMCQVLYRRFSNYVVGCMGATCTRLWAGYGELVGENSISPGKPCEMHIWTHNYCICIGQYHYTCNARYYMYAMVSTFSNCSVLISAQWIYELMNNESVTMNGQWIIWTMNVKNNMLWLLNTLWKKINILKHCIDWVQLRWFCTNWCDLILESYISLILIIHNPYYIIKLWNVSWNIALILGAVMGHFM